MRPSTPPSQSKAKSLVDSAQKRQRLFYTQGRYQEALAICLQITSAYPQVAGAWSSAAVNCVKLARWQDAIRYAQTALARGENTFTPYDALAHAYGHLKQWEQVRRHGLQALDLRARHFGVEPVVPLPEPVPMPPLPSAQTRERNIIAFSLFGRDSKYCEPAILNVQEQPHLYPHWMCRFYVDGSVPNSVIGRLRSGGAQIVLVDGAATQWPGPMWRLLALQDQRAHRILFRDADSVISRREAGAVGQWLASGKRFHVMRDWSTHTELMLAGLWGVVGGSLPPLNKLMERFMSAPLASEHFADQYFLRQYVWPYARTSLMQHDSIFGFMGGVAFPDGARPDDFHVGCLESLPVFSVKTELPNQTEVVWTLYRIEKREDGQTREHPVCTYSGVVKNGAVTAHIPERYARWIKQGTGGIRLAPSAPGAPAGISPESR